MNTPGSAIFEKGVCKKSRSLVGRRRTLVAFGNLLLLLPCTVALSGTSLVVGWRSSDRQRLEIARSLIAACSRCGCCLRPYSLVLRPRVRVNAVDCLLSRNLLLVVLSFLVTAVTCSPHVSGVLCRSFFFPGPRKIQKIVPQRCSLPQMGKI